MYVLVGRVNIILLEAIYGGNLTVNKCPCKECISFAICYHFKRVDLLIDECCIIRGYISDVNTALTAIRTIKPIWYIKDKQQDVLGIAENLVRYSRSIRKKNYE